MNYLSRKSIARGENLGIKYEENINNILKDKELQLISTSSAGASDAPDGYFWFNQERYPIEIKKQNADFAQVELRWDKKNGFFYSGASKNPYFSNFLINNSEFLEEINKIWTDLPRKFTSGKLTPEDRHWDLDHFKDIKKNIDISYIERFYNLKEPPVYYIQIQNRGFYFLEKDIVNLGIPRINGKPYLRARVKTRSASTNKWGFLVAIKMPGIKSSVYDIEELENRKFPFPEGSHIDERQKSINDFV